MLGLAQSRKPTEERAGVGEFISDFPPHGFAKLLFYVNKNVLQLPEERRRKKCTPHFIVARPRATRSATRWSRSLNSWG